MALDKWERQHIADAAKLEKKIREIYDEAIREAAALSQLIDGGRLTEDIFTFDNFPATFDRIKKLRERMAKGIQTSIVNGVRSQWLLSNSKNDELCRNVFGLPKNSQGGDYYRRFFNNNETALNAFLERKTNGMDLSKRVWNMVQGYQTEIELGLDAGIRQGLSAADIAKELKECLVYPDKLFRRVRDAHSGELTLSQAAKDFHPGQGVYRSSFMNARRLAVTETNMAYRTADYERWQQLDFVVGISIELSNNHTCKGVKGVFVDICDELRGEYPKDFKFVGWHPHCRCHAVPITKTIEEMKADSQRIMAGLDPVEGSVNEVKDVPSRFSMWIDENRDRIKSAKKLPYFIKDNKATIDVILDGSVTPFDIALTRHNNRTAEYVQSIMQRNFDRRRNMYGVFSDVSDADAELIIENRKAVTKSLGVRPGVAMDKSSADKQSANPNYKNGEPWRVNCATCAPAYALRRNGINVYAKPKLSGTKNDWMSKQHSFDVWKKTDGSNCIDKVSYVNQWMSDHNYDKMTPLRYKKWLDEYCKEEGIYIITLQWKFGGGHATIIERLADGRLVYVEPQVYTPWKGQMQDIDKLVKSLSAKPGSKKGILRVDDKLFDLSFVDLFEIY